MVTPDRLTGEFARRYRRQPDLVVEAPGRVNLIGEHTDYNEGFVLPMAIERSIHMAVSPRQDGHVQLVSLDDAHPVAFDTNRMERAAFTWGEYVKGVAWALRKAGYVVQGFDGLVSGDIPVGAGLSSSAALELAAAWAFAMVGGFSPGPEEMARLCQLAENDWVGMRCGIMDQMICADGREGQALMIDCRDLSRRPVALPRDLAIVIMDTGTRRELVGSPYVARREQCRLAAEALEVASLRDLQLEELLAAEKRLPQEVFRRARHVVSENLRVQAAAAAMAAGDGDRLGHLMVESHRSLRDDFEVSSLALDTMVAIARSTGGCQGARMTGAGFGGCAVAVVKKEEAKAFAAAVKRDYQARTGITARMITSRPAVGAGLRTGVNG